MNKKVLTMLFALAMALAIAPSTEAASIRIWDGVNGIITIDDNLLGDTDGDLGELQTLTVGYGVWTLTFTAATTTPSIGSPTEPQMEFRVAAASSAAGFLVLDFSETGFSSGPNAVASFSGNVAGSVTYTTLQDLGNNLFLSTTPLTSQVFPAGTFSTTFALGTVDPGSPYSLTQRVSITHTAAGASSVSTTLSVPDGGLTLSLLGFGLMGIEGLRRKFKV